MKNTFIGSERILKQNFKEKWYIVDAKDKCLGRIATKTSNILRGKNKITFTPWQNIGDYVIIINAENIKVTGKKDIQKLYFRHSGRPGGKTIENFQTLQSRLPTRIIEKAIRGMLPKGRLGRKLFNKLKIYPGSKHPHIAQKPQMIEID